MELLNSRSGIFIYTNLTIMTENFNKKNLSDFYN